MKILLLIFTLFLAVTARGESWPGFRHPIVIVQDQQVSDAPEKSSMSIRIPDAPFDKDEIVILYETKSRSVIHARWMTKGGSELLLPTMGISLSPRPEAPHRPVIILSTEKLTDAEPARVAFLGILWVTDEKK